MSEATSHKANAIRRAIRNEEPYGTIGKFSHMIACLTSADKTERDFGKRQVRELVKIGAELIARDQDAQGLADFANRCDQDAGNRKQHFRICCSCGTIWPDGIELPPRQICPACTARCTTGVDAETIELAIASRPKGHRYKIWKG